MNFAFNEDQDRLRDSAVRFLRDRIDLGRLTAKGNRPDTTYDAALWNEIVALGWTGLIVPEEYGGLGMGLVDWVVITEEIGRTLAPCPYLGNYAGTLALHARRFSRTEGSAAAADRRRNGTDGAGVERKRTDRRSARRHRGRERQSVERLRSATSSMPTPRRTSSCRLATQPDR